MTFQVTIMFGLGFIHKFFVSHFIFCWVIFMTDNRNFFHGFLAAILNWNFRFQTSEFGLQTFKFQKSQVPTELFYSYIDIYLFFEMGIYSEGPVNTLPCLSVG